MKNLRASEPDQSDSGGSLGFLRSSGGLTVKRGSVVDGADSSAKEERNRALRKRAIEATEDPLADLKYLEETSLIRDYQSSLLRAVLHTPGPDSDVDERTRAYQKLLATALEYSSKLVAVMSRTLTLTAAEKKHAVAKMMPLAADIAASDWVRSAGRNDTAFPLDESLSSLHFAREEIDQLAAKYAPEGGYRRGSGKEKDYFIAKVKASLLSGCLPVLAEIGSSCDVDEEVLSEIVSSYHDFFVNDSLRFLETMSSAKMKLYEEIKIDLMFSRIQGLSSMLVSDIRRQVELGDLEMSREYVLKRSLPAVRGLAYQVSTMADAAVSGLKTVYPEFSFDQTASIADLGLVKREASVSGPQDDRSYMSQLMRVVPTMSPCIKAELLISSGAIDDVSISDMVSTTSEVLKPFYQNAVRGLDLSDADKKSATADLMGVVSDCVANTQLTGKSLSELLEQKPFLKHLKITKGSLQAIGSKLNVSEQDLSSIRIQDICTVLLKDSFSSALTPLASEIAYMAEGQEPRLISDLLETYKNYLVADTQKFFSLMKEDGLKVNIVSKVFALKSRLQSAAGLLVSDLRAYYSRNEALPSSKYVASNSIPVIRGFAYQSDELLTSASGFYRVIKSDINPILSELEFNSINNTTKNNPDSIKIRAGVESTAGAAGGLKI